MWKYVRKWEKQVVICISNIFSGDLCICKQECLSKTKLHASVHISSQQWLTSKLFPFRHNLQDHHAKEDPLLHGKPDNPLCRHNFPHRSRILSTLRFWRKSYLMRIDSSLAYSVLSVIGGNYTSNFLGSAVIGEIPVVYYDPGYIIHMGHCVRAQRSFQVSCTAFY